MLGYSSGSNIVNGACWGKYMIVYSKTGVKSKKVIARIYIREESIILLYLSSENCTIFHSKTGPLNIKN